MLRDKTLITQSKNDFACCNCVQAYSQRNTINIQSQACSNPGRNLSWDTRQFDCLDAITKRSSSTILVKFHSDEVTHSHSHIQIDMPDRLFYYLSYLSNCMINEHVERPWCRSCQRGITGKHHTAYGIHHTAYTWVWRLCGIGDCIALRKAIGKLHTVACWWEIGDSVVSEVSETRPAHGFECVHLSVEVGRRFRFNWIREETLLDQSRTTLYEVIKSHRRKNCDDVCHNRKAINETSTIACASFD